MSRRGWTVVGIVAVVLLAGYYAWWFYTHFESREREVRLEVSAAARRNPLLAAERFLRRLGREVESISGRDRLLQLPPPGDVLLVRRLISDLTPEREAALSDWLSDGGHLVICPGQEWDEETGSGGNRFLEGYGIRLHVGADTEKEEEDGSQPGRVAVVTSDGEETMEVAFDRTRWLQDTDGADGEGERPHLLQYTVGSGSLTVLSDTGFLDNDHIGDADHARFLASLVEDGGKVWLLYSSAMPSLLTLLWRSQPHLVLSVLLLTALWLRWLVAFTGPRHAPLEGSGRRNLLDHLDAASAFAWRTDRAQWLLQRSRETLLQDWLRRHHRLVQMGRHERCDWIAAHCGLPRRTVDSALYGEAGNEQEFVRISAAQQRLVAVMNRRKERE